MTRTAETIRGEVLLDLPRESYEKLPGENWSRLKAFAKSPAHYRWECEHPKEETDAMRLGTATHLAILEPEKFRAECVRWDGGHRKGKAWEEFSKKYEDRTILSSDQWDDAHAMRAAVMANPHAAALLAEGNSEVTVLWANELLPGVVMPCKGRPDWIGPNAIVDVKSTRDASPEAFGRQVVQMGYHGQMAFYSDGYFAATGVRLPVYFIAVESDAPHVVAVYRVLDDVLAMGRALCERYLTRLAICRTTNEWPGYFENVQDLVLPRWATANAESVWTEEVAS